MNAKPLLLPLFLVAMPLSPATADVLNVRGPNPDYNQINDAVVAAQDGDVIRVWPGSYGAFWIDDKSLSLVKATPTGTVTVDGTYRVRYLASHRSVQISGIGADGIDGNGLVVDGCQGSVRIQESTFTGGQEVYVPYVGKSAVYIIDSDDVEMTHCTARGGWGGDGGEYGAPGGNGMMVEASDVSLYASLFEGAHGSTDDDPGAYGHSGGHGIYAWGGGRTYLSGCTLIGGDGGDGDWMPDIWTNQYGAGGDGGWGYRGTGTEAWYLDNDFQPGVGGWSGDPGSYGIDGQDASAGTYLPGDARLLSASQLIDDTASIALVFTGTPGDLVFLHVSGSPAYDFDDDRGPFLLAARPFPDLRPWKFLGVIGSSGTFTTTLGVADRPAFGHHTRHLQGNLIGAENYFTSSSCTVILDSAW